MREIRNAADVLCGTGFTACLAIGMLTNIAPADAKWISLDIAGVETIPVAIDDKGVIAGYYVDSNDAEHGFLRESNGTITSFDAADGVDTQVAAMNGKGAVTGYYVKIGEYGHGFLRTLDGTIASFDASPHGINTSPAGMNGKGAIVGYWYLNESPFGYRGFLRSADGKLTTFEVAKAADTYAIAINNDGFIAGDYIDAMGAPHGFLRSPDGSITKFEIPGVQALYVTTASINSAGQIVGSYVTDPDHYYSHAFLREVDGTTTTLDLGTRHYTVANGINDEGQIVGGYDANGFVLLPDGKLRTLDYPGTDSPTTAVNINGKGKITGYYLGCSAVSACGFLK